MPIFHFFSIDKHLLGPLAVAIRYACNSVELCIFQSEQKHFRESKHRLNYAPVGYRARFVRERRFSARSAGFFSTRITKFIFLCFSGNLHDRQAKYLKLLTSGGCTFYTASRILIHIFNWNGYEAKVFFPADRNCCGILPSLHFYN